MSIETDLQPNIQDPFGEGSNPAAPARRRDRPLARPGRYVRSRAGLSLDSPGNSGRAVTRRVPPSTRSIALTPSLHP